MWHKTTGTLCRQPCLHRFTRMMLRENPVEHPLDALTIRKVSQSLSHHKTLVTGPRPGQRIQQTIGLVVEYDLDSFRHERPPLS